MSSVCHEESLMKPSESQSWSARRRVAALTGRPPPSCCVAMDIGADEFEQSLPLLQELVLGADFKKKKKNHSLATCHFKEISWSFLQFSIFFFNKKIISPFYILKCVSSINGENLKTKKKKLMENLQPSVYILYQHNKARVYSPNANA